MTETAAATPSVHAATIPVLHRAPWVLPMAGPGIPGRADIVADGGVLIAGGRIQAVGGFRHLRGKYAGVEVADHPQSVLMPPLVNGHAHLELSHLAGLGTTPAAGDITGWIRNLVESRIHFAGPDDAVTKSASRALAGLHETGTGLVADIGNLMQSRLIGSNRLPLVIFCLEFFGLTGATEKGALNRLRKIPELSDPELNRGLYSFTCAPHAPYSTGAVLIRGLKDRVSAAGRLFTIHAAESAAEVEFLREGTGSFRRFLQERDEMSGPFTPPGLTPIRYLDSLGVLDKRTLCVHAVHVTADEIDILADRSAGVCLCPGSNRFLGVGRAPVAGFLARGILPALGTDSLASNPALNLWEEMRILRQDHPGLAPAAVLAMATRGGAEALGAEREIGVLAPGTGAHFLQVSMPEVATDEIIEYLTTAGAAVEISWVE